MPKTSRKSRKLATKFRAETMANPVNPWAHRPQQTVNGRKLVMTRAPELLHNDAGEVIGVEVRVRLYDADGVELAIDPVRRFVNPPTIHAGEDDPAGALWAILWDSIEVAPNPDDWVPPWQ